MGIVLTDFQGEMLGVSNYDLPVNAASSALNCDFSGTLKPAGFSMTTAATGQDTNWPVKVYDRWLMAAQPNGILPSPMADDALDRMYCLMGGVLHSASAVNADRTVNNALIWTAVGTDAPLCSIIASSVTQPKKVIALGSTQTPTGNPYTLEFCLMYFGIGTDGKQYYSSPTDAAGSATGYSNSEVVITLPTDWVTTDFHAFRYKLQEGASHSHFIHTGQWADTHGPQIGLFYRRNATWELVHDSAVWGLGVTTLSIGFSATKNRDWTHNTANTFITENTFIGGSETTVDLAADMLSFVKVDVVQAAVAGAGSAEVEEIPEGEVGIYRSYILTACKIIGTDANGNQVLEEGVPSEAVIVGPIYSNSKVIFSFPPVYEDRNGNPKLLYNLYRANAGTYLYVGSSDTLTKTATTFYSYIDDIPDDALGEACPSMDWLPPPASLDGLVSLGYGFFVGWKGNRIYCSELYLPHAWPSAYSYAAKYNIRRCIVVHNGILAITDNGNYFIAGSTPIGLNVIELPTFHPCIADSTAVDMGDGVVYAAPTGLALVNSSTSRSLTEQLVDPTWWAAQTFSDAYRLGDSYVITISGERYRFNLRNKTLTKSSSLPEKATLDQSTGNLRTVSAVISPSSYAAAYKWVSKMFEFNHAQPFAWVQCIAKSYTPAITLVFTLSKRSMLGNVDSVVATRSVVFDSNKPLRFPAGAWNGVQVGVESAAHISKIVLTNNKAELEYVG